MTAVPPHHPPAVPPPPPPSAWRLDAAVALMPERYATWRRPLLLLGGYVGVQLVVVAAVLLGLSAGLATVLGGALLVAVTVVVCRPLARAAGSWGTALGVRPPRWPDLGYALAGFGTQFGVRLVVVALLVLLVPRLTDVTHGNLVGLDELPTVDVALIAAAAVLVAPVVEEIAFRGLWLRVLMRRWSFWPAALVSSAAFAALHAFQAESALAAVVLVINLFVFGLVQCVLVRWRESLAPAMLTHALVNGVALAVVAAL